ncbi:MAG: hypothetical protein M3548_13290 [Actinomycetota bacterium]|nr:hypothetical protein [Actinomycetota bacterium]
MLADHLGQALGQTAQSGPDIDVESCVVRSLRRFRPTGTAGLVATAIGTVTSRAAIGAVTTIRAIAAAGGRTSIAVAVTRAIAATIGAHRPASVVTPRPTTVVAARTPVVAAARATVPPVSTVVTTRRTIGPLADLGRRGVGVRPGLVLIDGLYRGIAATVTDIRGGPLIDVTARTLGRVRRRRRRRGARL